LAVLWGGWKRGGTNLSAVAGGSVRISPLSTPEPPGERPAGPTRNPARSRNPRVAQAEVSPKPQEPAPPGKPPASRDRRCGSWDYDEDDDCETEIEGTEMQNGSPSRRRSTVDAQPRERREMRFEHRPSQPAERDTPCNPFALNRLTKDHVLQPVAGGTGGGARHRALRPRVEGGKVGRLLRLRPYATDLGAESKVPHGAPRPHRQPATGGTGRMAGSPRTSATAATRFAAWWPRPPRRSIGNRSRWRSWRPSPKPAPRTTSSGQSSSIEQLTQPHRGFAGRHASLPEHLSCRRTHAERATAHAEQWSDQAGHRSGLLLPNASPWQSWALGAHLPFPAAAAAAR